MFGEVLAGHDMNLMGNPSESEEHQDKLDNAAALHESESMANTLSGARCVNDFLMRPMPAEEEPPSTACRPNVVNAPGGVVLGRGPPGFGQSPGSVPLVRSLHLHSAATYPRECGHHYIRGPRRQEEGPPNGPGGGTGSGVGDQSNQQAIHTKEEGHQGPMTQEEHNPQEEGIQAVVQAAAVHLQAQHLHSSQEEQAIQVAAANHTSRDTSFRQIFRSMGSLR